MYSGLTNEEVEKRKEANLVNKSINYKSKSYLEIIKENVLTFFNLCFLIIAILIITARDYKSLTFIPLILLNLIIGIVQEIKSKKLIDKLTLINISSIEVYRNNKLITIKSDELVQDDIVIFKSGMQIVADAYVLEGEAYVNESLLTGEEDEISKSKDSSLLSGSFVVSGKVVAKITNVGNDSYINKLTVKARINKKEYSELKNSLNKILVIVSIIIVPLALFLIFQSLNRGESYSQAIISMSGSILMMIPEGLFLLSSVSLALSAYKLAKNNVLIQSLNSIESLSRVNVLCLDKTGTITTNKMNVYDYISNNITKEELYNYVSCYAFYQDNDNQTIDAIKKYFNTINNKEEFINKLNFNSKYKYSVTTFKDYSIIVGAIEYILKDNYNEYYDIINKYSSLGYRVVSVVKTYSTINIDLSNMKFEVLGFIILENEIRESASKTFEYFYSQGVDIKVISGDNALTVANVCKKANIKNSDKYIDCIDIKESEINNIVNEYTIFGRVTPQFKQLLIKALKNNGNKVAMTGDGVNDILALKEADCSIAMSSGSDAAIKASSVVLLDSDFSKMPNIVFEGRRVVNNLSRSGSLFITKNIFSILLTLFCIFANFTFPIKPTQTSLINTFSIGLPAFLLSLQPNKNIIKGKFINNILKCAIPSGLVEALMVFILMIVAKNNDLDNIEVSCLSTMLMGLIGIVVIFNIARPYSKYKLICASISAFGLVLNFSLAFKIPFFTNYYAFSNISKECWKLFLIFTPISIASYIVLYALFNLIKPKNNKLIERLLK